MQLYLLYSAKTYNIMLIIVLCVGGSKGSTVLYYHNVSRRQSQNCGEVVIEHYSSCRTVALLTHFIKENYSLHNSFILYHQRTVLYSHISKCKIQAKQNTLGVKKARPSQKHQSSYMQLKGVISGRGQGFLKIQSLNL